MLVCVEDIFFVYDCGGFVVVGSYVLFIIV